MQVLKRLVKDYWPALALGILGAIVLFWKLGQNTMVNWDEGEFAQIPREMIQSGDYLTPYWGYRPKFHQPPLYVWCTVIFYRLLGITEVSARAASALSGVGLLLLTYAIGRLNFNKWVGLLGGLVLLTSFGFLDQARFATTDAMLGFFIYAALYAYMRVERGNESWWYVAWIAFALAVMTKSAGGLIAPAVIGLLILVNGGVRATLRSKQFWAGSLVAFLLILPWPIYMYSKHGLPFINDFFLYHIVARTATPLEGHEAQPMYYIQELSLRFFPWVYLVPYALTFFSHEALSGRRQSLPLLFMAALVFGLFTLVQTKLYWYILPLYPALSILVAAVLVNAITVPKSMAFSAVLVTGFLAVLANPVYLDTVYPPLTLKAALLLFVFALLLGGYAFITKTVFKPAALLLTVLVLLVAVTNSRLVYTKTTDEVAELARLEKTDKPTASDPLLLYSGVDWPSALFYSNRRIKRIVTESQLRKYIQDGRPKRIILAKRSLESLVNAFEVSALSDTKKYLLATVKRKQALP